MEQQQEQAAMDCLQSNEGGCAGAVQMRHALSASGTPYPRCQAHWEQRMRRQAELERRYPDSDVPPPGFDPSYAGESWDEEG